MSQAALLATILAELDAAHRKAERENRRLRRAIARDYAKLGPEDRDLVRGVIRQEFGGAFSMKLDVEARPRAPAG